jgi:hypothetical protein
MNIQAILNTNWSDFIVDWCLGIVPSFTEEQANNALTALKCFWPEHLEELLQSGSRGIGVIGTVIFYGQLINQCNHLHGFAQVMARIRQGERSALSELNFAKILLDLGYQPNLEAVLHQRTLDALIIAEGSRIYFEVIAPDESDAMRSTYRAMQTLANDLAINNLGSRIELFLETELTLESSQHILAFVEKIPYSKEVRDISGIALIRKQRHESPNDAITPVSSKMPQTSVTHATNMNGVLTVVDVGIRPYDNRIGRLLDDESKHFSREEINILVMNVSRIPIGLPDFIPLIQRRLQPHLNRRFSAVILFTQFFRVEDGMPELDWHMIINPHAYRQVPISLAQTLSLLSSKVQS